MAQKGRGAMDANGIVRDLETYRTTVLGNLTGPWRTLWSDELALKRLVTHQMPTIIYYAEHDNTMVYWVTLGMQAPEWRVVPAPLPSWIAAQLEDGNRVVGGAGPTAADMTTVYMARYPGEPFAPFSADVHEFLTDKAAREVQRWRRMEDSQWAHIGWRDWVMTRFPDETPPCPEMAGVGRFRRAGETGPVTIPELFEDLRAIRTLTVVPESVWSLLNRAAKLYAFGYLEWEFFTMAQHQATMALEASLKALYMRDRAVPLRVQVRDGQNAIVDEREFRERLKSYRVLAEAVDNLRDGYRSCGSNKRRILVDGAPFPAKKTDLAQWALSQEWISANEHKVLRAQFRRRDRMSHPERAERDWISQVYGTLERCTRLVNRMWARREVPTGLLWEHAYENAPRWRFSSL